MVKVQHFFNKNLCARATRAACMDSCAPIAWNLLGNTFPFPVVLSTCDKPFRTSASLKNEDKPQKPEKLLSSSFLLHYLKISYSMEIHNLQITSSLKLFMTKINNILFSDLQS